MPGNETILLDRSTWDLVLDASGDIAHAREPYSLAQDAASAIKTFLGEAYFDTDLGVPYMSKILAKNPPLAVLKAELVAAALTVAGVAGARCFITGMSSRGVSGQVQVVSRATGRASATDFAVLNPQGAG